MQETVIDEEVFLDGQLGITPLQIACTVARDPVAQGEILSARRCSNRIGLHETEFADGATERGRLEQGARNRVATQLVPGDPLRSRHPSALRRHLLVFPRCMAGLRVES
jgi:hypothetical protein